jgi:hypothetical protein
MLVYTHKCYDDENEYTVVSLSERCVAMLSILHVVAFCPVAVEFSAVVGNNNVHQMVTSLSAFVHKVFREEKQRL